VIIFKVLPMKAAPSALRRLDVDVHVLLPPASTTARPSESLADLVVVAVALMIDAVALAVEMTTTDVEMTFMAAAAEVVVATAALAMAETGMTIAETEATTVDTEIEETMVALTNTAPPAKNAMAEMIATADERNAEAEVTMAARIVVMALTINRPRERVVVTTTGVTTDTLAEEWFR